MSGRIIGKSWDYWFLLKSNRAVWINMDDGEILVEHKDRKLYQPTKDEKDQITVHAIFAAYKGG